MASSTRQTVDVNLLDLAADEQGQSAPRALGRRLPELIGALLAAGGVSARHASATLPLSDEDEEPRRLGWAVPAGLLDEGAAIELSRRLGPARFLAFGQLAPAGASGLTLKLRVLRREDAGEVHRDERDFFEEEVLDIAQRVAADLAALVGAREAVEAVDAAAVAGTSHPEALLRLQEGLDGLAAVEGGLDGASARDAVEHLLAALELDPSCGPARDHALAALAREPNAPHTRRSIPLDEVASAAKRLVELRPDDVGAVTFLARLHHRRGAPAEARALLSAALRRAPSSAALALELARTHSALGDLEEGLAVCRRALDAEHLEATDAERAGLHAEAGLALARQGRFDEAIAELERSLQLDPDQAAPHANLARCLHLTGDRTGALAAYDRSLHLAPGSWEVARNAAELLLELGAFEEAALRLRVWAEERPDDPRAVLVLGETLLHLGRADEARALLVEATARHPENPQLLALFGGLLTQLGLLEEAEDRYREALRFSPDDPALLSNLAVLLTQRGDLDGAEELASRAVRLDPTDEVSAQVLDHIRRFPQA